MIEKPVVLLFLFLTQNDGMIKNRMMNYKQWYHTEMLIVNTMFRVPALYNDNIMIKGITHVLL